MVKFILRLINRIRRWLPKNFGGFFKWVILSLITGGLVGIVSSAFNLCLKESEKLRTEYPFIILLLPLSGILIVGIYRFLKLKHDKGTNMVIMAVRDGENMTWRNTLSIFTGSVLTHIAGGSAGREGAALQIGGSMGSQIGLWLRLEEQDHRLITMCGMSAGFSALFGTPAAAAFFSMEVISVGIMHYSAIVPCVIAALTGFKISSHFGVAPMAVAVRDCNIDVMLFIKAAVLAILCGLLSIVFCFVLKNTGVLYKKFIKNSYLRIFTGGILVASLTFICGTYDYNGAGGAVIIRSFGESAPFYDCSLGAAIGLSCLFCGVTNCPVTAVLLCMELFGVKYLPVYILTCAIAYMLSGYAGLYSEQKILYSKLEPKFIDKKVGK